MTSRAAFTPDRIATLALVVATATLLLLSTRLGIGITPDSTAYLGLRPHDPGHAPLYSAIMRLGALLPGSTAAFARLYHVMLYAATAAVVWHLVREATDRVTAAWAAAALVAGAGQAVWLYSMALSEPTFVLLLVLGIGWLSAWVDDGRPQALMAAAVAASLATLARYPGVALVATGTLTVLLASSGTLVRRFAYAAAFGAVGVLPTAAWTVYVASASGTVGGRSAALGGNASAETFYEGALEAARYMLPTEFPAALRIAALAVVLALLVAATLRFYAPREPDAPPARQTHRSLPLIVTLFMATYSAVVVLAVLVEPWLPISDRYLFPAYVALVLLGAITLPALVTSPRGRRVLAAGVMAFVALAVVRGVKSASEGYTEGWGYSSTAWRSSATVDYLSTLPPRAVVYSDNPYALLYLTKREVREVPPKIERRLGAMNPHYERDLVAMRDELLETHGVIVIFDRDRGEFVMPVLPDLERHLPLYEVRRFADSHVYSIADGRHRTARTDPR